MCLAPLTERIANVFILGTSEEKKLSILICPLSVRVLKMKSSRSSSGRRGKVKPFVCFPSLSVTWRGECLDTATGRGKSQNGANRPCCQTSLDAVLQGRHNVTWTSELCHCVQTRKGEVKDGQERSGGERILNTPPRNLFTGGETHTLIKVTSNTRQPKCQGNSTGSIRYSCSEGITILLWVDSLGEGVVWGDSKEERRWDFKKAHRVKDCKSQRASERI